MKRRAFVRELETSGCRLLRHGKRHDLYINPENKKKAPIPRHTQIRRTLCDLIRKQLGLK